MSEKILTEKRRSEMLDIPLRILRDRDVAVLESIAEYLVNEKKMKYSEIGKLLNRDQRTIWSVCNRAKKKRIVTVRVKESLKIKNKK